MVPYNTAVAPHRALVAALTLALFGVKPAAGQTDSTRARPDSGARPEPPRQQTPARTATYMNIGFVGLVDAGWSSARDVGALQPGDHDPKNRGFTIPNVELTFDGAVDPYFKGFANIVHKIDANGESGVELEEAYFLTTSLPANLQVKAGQFFTEFGRQNSQHPHSWTYVDQPLVLNRMFGPDGLRGQGARVSWLVPTSWYLEAMVTLQNSAGETMSSFRSDESSDIHGGVPVERDVLNFSDMLVAPRVTTSFELNSTQTLLLGVSAAFGPNNSGPDARTEIYGADLFWKWKSARADKGFPFVSVQSEFLTRRYDAAEREVIDDPGVFLPAETLKDDGAYAEVAWGIKPRLVAALRGEFANGQDAAFDAVLRADRTRFSPNLTWFPTEFSKVRFQYNYDDRAGIGIDHSFWVQFEFILGAHAAHKF
ncbi:MAG TPA: hypothetical protein VJU15_16435 [Gemmatimonadales bacterium]|nr:hypothetical protein [Gemmatimonadales bacterium]